MRYLSLPRNWIASPSYQGKSAEAGFFKRFSTKARAADQAPDSSPPSCLTCVGTRARPPEDDVGASLLGRSIPTTAKSRRTPITSTHPPPLLPLLMVSCLPIPWVCVEKVAASPDCPRSGHKSDTPARDGRAVHGRDGEVGGSGRSCERGATYRWVFAPTPTSSPDRALNL